MDNNIVALLSKWRGEAANSFESKYHYSKKPITNLISMLEKLEKSQEKLAISIERAKREYEQELAQKRLK